MTYYHKFLSMLMVDFDVNFGYGRKNGDNKTTRFTGFRDNASSLNCASSKNSVQQDVCNDTEGDVYTKV